MPSKKKPSPPPAVVPGPEAVLDPQTIMTEYIALMHDDAAAEMARLAASMAPAAASFDAAALVSQAIAIRIEAEHAIPARRTALLDRADVDQLRAVSSLLLAKERKPGNEKFQRYRQHFNAYLDKRQGMEWEKVMEQHNAGAPEREVERRAFFDALQTECGPLPQFPCSLEVAIRWVTKAPDKLPWRILEEAFKDWIKLAVASRHLRHTEGNDDRKFLTDSVSWYGGIASNEENQPELRREHRAKADAAQAQLDYLDELDCFVSEFAPGRQAPRELDAEVLSGYYQSWKDNPMEADRQGSLHYLANDFRQFWQKHGSGYIKDHETAERSAVELSKKMESTGAVGLAARERGRWIHYTQSFVEWASGREVTPQLINEFPKQPGVVRGKGSEFLRTLLNAKGDIHLHKSLWNTLRNVGITVPQEVAADCFSILVERKIIAA